MKKNFKLYIVVWASLLALFNLITFVIPSFPEKDKFTPSFWIGYVFITLTFIGQFICTFISFKSNSIEKVFYKIPLIKIGFWGLVASFIVGSLCMIMSFLPYWVGVIICAIVLVVNIIATVKVMTAINYAESVDEKIKTATAFIYDMRGESESLLARAKSEEVKAICKKVSDAFKFSDPMSNDGLTSVETEIKEHFRRLYDAVKSGNIDVASLESEEVLAFITERNNKCKRLK